MTSGKKYLTVCVNRRANPDLPSCGMRGGQEIAEALRAAIAAAGLAIELRTFHCLGQCELGPNAKLSPGGEFCHGITPADLGPLLQKIAAFADA